MHTYRPELDGLRALAIIPVILFHLHPGWIPGGFLGVDVFFVLSGFLITSAILPRMDQLDGGKAFSFLDFYFRRVKRLLPAILALILVLQCFGSLILFNSEWRSLSAQAGSVIGVFANFFFWKQAGNYWGTAAEGMPLLHAWSLSVEEQFYLIYPIFLSVILRLNWKRDTTFWFVLVTALLSFIGFIYARRHFPDAGFFWSIFRAWELLAGCLIAIFRHSHPRAAGSPGKLVPWLPLVGLGIILFGYGSGWGISVISYRNALMTVLGTCLVILFSDNKSRFTWPLLTLPPLVGIGLISYSLYLWHWPVIVFSRLAGIYSMVFMVVLTLVLAYFSYRLIEKPLRFCDNQRFRCRFSLLLGATLLSLLLPFVIKRAGTRYKSPDFSHSINLEPGNTNPHYGDFTGSARTGLSLFSPNDGAGDVVVLGDSHSLMFFPPIRESCAKLGLKLTFFGADGGTSPFFMEEGAQLLDYGKGWSYTDRKAFDHNRIQYIKESKPRYVFICARWSTYHSWNKIRFSEHLKRIREASSSSTLIFVGQPPELPFGSEGFTTGVLDHPTLRAFSELPYATDFRQIIHARLREFCASNQDCHFIETEQHYLRSGKPYFMEGETLFYKDDDHLSIAGAMLARSSIEELLRRLR